MIQKIGRADLPGGGIGIIEGTIAPGELVAPHIHADVNEVSYVLAGEITADESSAPLGQQPGCSDI